MPKIDKIRLKLVKKLFTIKFPESSGIFVKLLSYSYFYIMVKDILKYNFFISFLNLRQDKIKIRDNTKIIYYDHKKDHYEITKLHKEIEKLDIVLFNKVFFVFDKSYPYFVTQFINKKIKILHIGTIEFLSLHNSEYLFKTCKKNNIFLIATYHSFGDIEENIEMLKKCNLVIALSNQFKEVLETYGLKNVIVNYLSSSYSDIKSPPKDEIRKKHYIPLDKIVFSLVGNIRIDKGYDFFINAITKLSSNYKENIFINLIGKDVDSCSQSISDLLNNCGVDHKFQSTSDLLTEQEFVENISLADVCIFPYTRDTINASGPLIEAGIRRIPVFGTDNGDIGYTIKKWNIGLTFKHKDNDDLQYKIIEFIDKIDDLRFDFDQFVTDHKSETFIEKNKSIYEDVLNNNFNKNNYG